MHFEHGIRPYVLKVAALAGVMMHMIPDALTFTS